MELRLENQEITSLRDITSCQDKSQVTTLDITSCPLESLDGIEELINLDHCLLWDTEITSFQGIEKCPKLTRLECSFSPLKTPFLGVGDFPTLEYLEISSDELSLEGLGLCPKLRKVEINSPILESIKELRGCSNLEKLNIEGCKELKSLQGIEGCLELTHLNCNFTGIDSLLPLSEMGKLVDVRCEGTNITSLRGLEKNRGLMRVSCIDSTLTSLRGIENATKLEGLFCGNTKITSLEPLSEMTELDNLFLCCCLLTSLRGLEKATKIKTLVISYNPLQSLDGLNCKPSHLEMEGTNIA